MLFSGAKMYTLAKILKVFFLPAGTLFFLLFVASISSLFRKDKFRRITRRFVILSLFYLYAISIDPISNFLMINLAHKYQPIQKKVNGVKAIVVLGGGAKEAKNLPIAFQLSRETLLRLMECLRLWRMYNGKVMIVASGGSAGPFIKKTPESTVMKKFLIERGVPQKAIILEDKSRNTYENIVYSETLLKKFKIDPTEKNNGRPVLILCTSIYHLLRANLIAEKRKWNFLSAPAPFLKIHSPATPLSYLPSFKNFSQSHRALHEYVGIAYYKLKGYI